MRKSDLFVSTSAYALPVGLDPDRVRKDREHMEELILKAESKKEDIYYGEP